LKKDPDLGKWVVFTEEKASVSCRYCRITLQAKYSTLKSHSQSKKHEKSIAPFFVITNKSQPTICFHKTNYELQEYEGRLALYIAVHSSINPVGHLTECNKLNFKKDATAQGGHLARTKCLAIIKNVWGPHFCHSLREDLGDSHYSLMIDESTDIAVKKYLGVVIKYFSFKRKKFTSTYLKLVPITNCNADSLVTAIKVFLFN
jgi:hypothetical protein